MPAAGIPGAPRYGPRQDVALSRAKRVVVAPVALRKSNLPCLSSDQNDSFGWQARSTFP
jgi:hypothetical protein